MTNLFQETLTTFVYRARYSAGQLADLTGIPKRTVANWLSGRVRRPRQWQEVVRLAAALHLSAAETDDLLTAAGHENLSTLRRDAGSGGEQGLLASWPAGHNDQPARHGRRGENSPGGATGLPASGAFLRRCPLGPAGYI